ncbi:SDR family NAD(P)-dependent oxidoreductase, partial [bacterium]|nr:SDR family NAD(P)-dependent oxidoreductase [bacterium]
MESVNDLTGRTALVTGGARRVGRHLALCLAREGANVVVHYKRSEEEARGLVAEIEQSGGHAATVAG